MGPIVPDAYRLFAGPFFAMSDHNRAMFENSLRMAQDESLYFIDQRLKRSAQTIEGLRDCGSFFGMMSVEQDFISGTITDSIEQTQRLAKFWWRMAAGERQSTGHPVETSATASSNDAEVPVKASGAHSSSRKVVRAAV